MAEFCRCASFVIIIGKDGTEHVPEATGWAQARAVSQCTFTFRGLPAKDVRVVEVQQRLYHWVEFRNVSLQRGHKTQVELVGMAATDVPEIESMVVGKQRH